MKISINRLKDYIPFDQSTKEIGDLLTAGGLEVEGISIYESVKGSLKGIVVGEVLSCEPHPNADKLSLTTVDIGTEIVPIVCGASNVAKGQKVPVATVGATLYPSSGESFEIKKAKIRGEVSLGMICAEDELGLGTGHEGILVLDTELPNGSGVAQLFDIKEIEVLEIGLTPNRADAASHLGVARDLKALLNKDLVLTDVEAFKVDNSDRTIKVSVADSQDCPRYSGLTLSNVKVAPSPKWLQDYIKAIGLEPINNVVDITNFILHDLGQPLHAFDAAKIQGDEIQVKRLPAGTKFVTLDGKERTLSGEELMICDNSEGLCIAGTLGGLDSGVSDQTTTIFLESACFGTDVVRKGAQFHGIKTDASFRFERGTDPNMPVFALKMAALLIKELTGAIVSSPIVDLYPEPVADFEIPVSYRHVDRLIGQEIGKERIKQILESLEIKVTNETDSGFVAIVKPYRVDVTREADIIEEILRIYGFESIPLKDNYQADFLAEHPDKDTNKLQYRVSEMLAGIGYSEILTNSLTKSEYAEKASFLDKEKDVIILNKLSEDLGVLRQSLLFTGLEVLAHNINRRQKDLKLYEFGSVYAKASEGYDEGKRLSFFLTGNATRENWMGTVKPVTFTDIYAIVEGLLTKLNIPQPDVNVVESSPYSFGLELMVNNKPLGSIGLLAPDVCKLADVKQEVYFAELDWERLSKLAKSQGKFQEISKFPEVRRDLSLVIDQEITFDQIRQMATKAGGKLLKRINVFDMYKGDKLEEGKKAYALSFYLQDNQQTLTDKVIDKTMGKLMHTFEKNAGALIRK
ncbi:phenylalanine--tRNA ligase subunit beta [Cyclobacterium qasimii]|uniref:Phenylalanine--tRNA ligase beta subunit n=2 Tax=Cyclobacterium qasimii TaxID=1350429 RepID=S7VB72_9BACT|nr:phenylalanine--tRNA ligase subunit beta [Cyclobacterium qasimii]EPR66792.1 Phenylalanyl-tRNA synthetase beta chain [Cyclobacterium qasimii M12-11B]GEO21683.1 phenylalanine--tRNA ligase beta subunit [Cyclobacterium qasimii]